MNSSPPLVALAEVTTGTDRTERLEPSGGEQRALLVLRGGRAELFPLPAAGKLVLGRAEGVDLRIEDAAVSRRHAALHVSAEGVLIEDLGSANGVRIRQRAIAPGARELIGPGETVELGTVLLLVQDVGVARLVSEAPSGPPPPAADHVVAEDPATQRLFALVARVAASELAVVILGETGSGKEIVAEAIHRGSRRRGGPFVGINCAALPATLVESELFGHVRGAFTGAERDRVGLVQQADGGTLFLDEIGDLALEVQAKLLRVIETRLVRPLGTHREHAIDVRFVCATHRDLPADVAERRFRADLYHRLNGVTLRVPPLRERRGDIVPLAHRFHETARRAQGLFAPLRPEIEALLVAQAWPGNLRELKSAIERAVALAEDEPIAAEHLELESREAAPDTQKDLSAELESVERARIVEALAKTRGNQTKAAALLGISRRTLITRIERYGLPRPRKV